MLHRSVQQFPGSPDTEKVKGGMSSTSPRQDTTPPCVMWTWVTKFLQKLQESHLLRHLWKKHHNNQKQKKHTSLKTSLKKKNSKTMSTHKKKQLPMSQCGKTVTKPRSSVFCKLSRPNLALSRHLWRLSWQFCKRDLFWDGENVTLSKDKHNLQLGNQRSFWITWLSYLSSSPPSKCCFYLQPLS